MQCHDIKILTRYSEARAGDVEGLDGTLGDKQLERCYSGRARPANDEIPRRYE